MTGTMENKPEKTNFLLLEDDPNDLFFVEHEFKEAGNSVSLHNVRDGVEAQHYLRGDGKFADRHCYPVPRVILMDLKMPRLNGFDFLDWLRHDAPGQLRFIPAVVMSSSVLQSDVVRSYELGANSYVVKPVNWDEFRHRIKAVSAYWAQCVRIPDLIN